MAKLLIVESPGKIKTLRKILGAGWEIQPSVGHITELAHDGEDSLGFDLGEDAIRCRYVPRGTRGKEVISKLRAAAQKAEHVYLATDPDREGEAIAWHIAQQLKLKDPKRIVYTQITEQAVKSALSKPRELDEHLISAQRCRQCLDKLVGYRVSPLLWNSTGGKSAGRVQSATLHLVCQREREIQAFKPVDYWSVWVDYQEGFRAFYKSGAEVSEQATEEHDDAKDETKAPESSKVLSQAEADRLVAMARENPHRVLRAEGKSTSKSPPPPFVTSSLQQSAGAALAFNPEATMAVAQSLYEGVELDHGPKGLITYMRTDSVELSPEFIEDARKFLQANDPENLPDARTKHRSKDSAQAAHEAIRPTDITLTPERVRPFLNNDQFRLYDLIWRRALASQCASAKLLKTTIRTQSGPAQWEARGMMVEFAGYTKYWNNLDKASHLPTVAQDQALNLVDAAHEKKQTQPPPRYTEPKLVQLMERKGIGRPSTYAFTIKTLKERNYLALKGKVIHPTELGMGTDQVLSDMLPDLVQSGFTAEMESSLDAIAEGKNQWERYLIRWNQEYLAPELEKAKRFIRSKFPTAPYRGGGGKPLEKSRTKCPQCNEPMSKVPSKKVSKKYFLKCGGACPDLVMFWSDREKKWQQPAPKPEGSGDAPAVAVKLTEYPCPVCKKPLQEYPYTKDGVAKTLLRCSDPKSRMDKKHKDAVFYQAQGKWWSPKHGELA